MGGASECDYHQQLDERAQAFLLTGAEGRRIRVVVRPTAPGLPLHRGVGMGGPACMFTWNLGFDPVAWIAQVAAACKTILYVDELLALVVGPGQATLVYLAFLAATKTAGLCIEDHNCECFADRNILFFLKHPFLESFLSTTKDFSSEKNNI